MRLRPSSLALAALGGLAVAAAAVPAAIAATPSHALLWQNAAKGNASVICGEEITPPGKPAVDLLCGAVGLPSVQGGDPSVLLGKTGKSKIVAISQDSYRTSTTATLKAGSTWSGLGITCTIGATSVKCTNASKHGFTLAEHSYKPF